MPACAGEASANVGGAEAAMVAEPDTVTAMRRDLGRQLAAQRLAAGYLQRELGALLGYSRTTVANAETGSRGIGRQLWERADRVLGTGEQFARGFARIHAQLAAESRASMRRPVPVVQAAMSARAPGQHADGLESSIAATALQACRERGWPAEEDQVGRLWLVTGTVIDALEVPRRAGMLAVGWWLYTLGVPDEIRGLPGLPDPASALAVITAGPKCYFLTRSGASPWTRQDTELANVMGSANAQVRWHAEGGRVLAPPSSLSGNDRATWAHVPSGDGQLVSPMALLHVLAHSVAATRKGVGVILPLGVRLVPAADLPAG
jgi:hypothetical protein